jgi:Tol biopolymer transport system component
MTSAPPAIYLMVLPLSGDRTPRPFLRTPFSETGARFSPDGKSVAYVSDVGGTSQIYVRPFEGQGETQQRFAVPA